MSESNSTVLGTERPGRTRVAVTAQELSRHTAFISASGGGAFDGARALVEAMARGGRDVVVVDTDGAFLSLERLDRKSWEAPVEVVPWTPASSLGIPLASNPLGFEIDGDPKSKEEQTAELAAALTSLLGWTPTVRDGKAVRALLTAAIDACHKRSLVPRDFTDLAGFIASPPRPYGAAFRRIASRELNREVRSRLGSLDSGASRLLFTHGAPLDVATLIGADEKRRPRISIIALGTLSSDEERGVLLVDLFHGLARWSRRDDVELPALCLGDAACALPSFKLPVRDAARRFLRRARARGMPCILATEAPSTCDLDELLRSTVVAVGPDHEGVVRDAVRKRLPELAKGVPASGLEAGEFTIVRGDVVSPRVRLRESRSSKRRVALSALNDLIKPAERRKFEDVGRALARARSNRTIADQLEGAASSPHQAERLLGIGSGAPENDYDAARRERLESALAYLRESRRLVTAEEVAEAIGATKAGAVRVLRELAGVGLAARVREGAASKYHAAELAYHPRAGLLEFVDRAPTLISREEAIAVAEKSVDRLLFVFEREAVSTDRVRCIHFPLWRCHFVGFERRGILRRLTTRAANVYLHPSAPQLCVMSRSKGFRFVSPDWQRNPVEIRDVDDITGFERGPARDLSLATWALDDLTSKSRAANRFKESFHLDADVTLVFLPVWEVTLEDKKDGTARIVHVDAVLGKPFTP